MLKQIEQTTLPYPLEALAQAVRALPVKLTEAQASQALDPVLKQIGRTTDPKALLALAQALQALPATLSEAQASQALDSALEHIRRTTDPNALQALAQALQALAPKLTEAKAVRASTDAAASSLAWSAVAWEAAEWARALVALSQRVPDRAGILVAAIAYPAAAGSATDVLLDAIRAGHSNAPAKEAGTEAALVWLAEKFPDVLRPPRCPEPLQPGLKCPQS